MCQKKIGKVQVQHADVMNTASAAFMFHDLFFRTACFDLNVCAFVDTHIIIHLFISLPN